MPIEIRLLHSKDAGYAPDLGRVLLECVRAGASVSFMADLTEADATVFYQGVFDAMARGERLLLAAFDGSDIVGTVQLHTKMPPNQPHRADVAKLLVRPAARGRGIGEQLMRAVEESAAREGKTLLVLDTATGESGERLYARLGWSRVGEIPNFALFPDGRSCATTIFYKALKSSAPSSPPRPSPPREGARSGNPRRA
ncbi:MAG: GNAT family N-acetyltransferase [Acidobacteriota bacterium]|nr:GNAT family N-acetyltransferase [Acidobacteriota bacterium]